ncbi:MAG: hypothetical protein IKC69_03055 [Clostridia bacterium]|nr:hypothetical protein [Clostridia bacterium]MBR2615638.1 hypothetical protein [Clostridia bacterium]
MKKILIRCAIGYACFVLVVSVLFISIRYNKTDMLSAEYIRTYPETIEEQYGAIEYISKTVLYPTEKEKDRIRSPYSVETELADVIVYVTLEKKDGEWKAVSMEIVEAKPWEKTNETGKEMTETVSKTGDGSDSPSTLPIMSTGEHYRVLKNGFKYVYQLFDLQGNLIEEIELAKEARIVAVDENIVCLTYQTGTGESTQWGFLYNAQTNQRSETFMWILDCTDEKVILGLPDGIEVRSIFDDTYYAKITDFEKDVATVADSVLFAEFVDGDNTIRVTYVEANTYELITELVKLP